MGANLKRKARPQKLGLNFWGGGGGGRRMGHLGSEPTIQRKIAGERKEGEGEVLNPVTKQT